MAGLIARKDDHGVKTTQTAGTEEWEWWKRWGRPWTRRRRRVHLDLAISPSLPPPLCSQLERGGSIWTVGMSHSPPSPPSHCQIECRRSLWTWLHHPAWPCPPALDLSAYSSVSFVYLYFLVFICIPNQVVPCQLTCRVTWHDMVTDWLVHMSHVHWLVGGWLINMSGAPNTSWCAGVWSLAPNHAHHLPSVKPSET